VNCDSDQYPVYGSSFCIICEPGEALVEDELTLRKMSKDWINGNDFYFRKFNLSAPIT
jgi:hypothetical protein